MSAAHALRVACEDLRDVCGHVKGTLEAEVARFRAHGPLPIVEHGAKGQGQGQGGADEMSE